MEVLSKEENFLGIDERFSRFETSKVIILPVPYEHTTSFLKGTRYAPSEILKASHELETYDEELEFELCKEVGIATAKPIDFSNKFDLDAINLIYETTAELIKKEKFIVAIGGEHTISIGIIKAFSEKYPNLSILQFDAHSDLRQIYDGNRYSHACVMARVFEINKNIVQIGIRAQCKEEAEFIKQNKIKTFYAHRMKNNNWYDDVIGSLSDDVYITFDLDYFDPSVMPAVGNPVPGGIGWDETLGFLKKLCFDKNIVGFDVVELRPVAGFEHATFTTAFLINKILNLIFYAKIHN